MRNIFIFLLVTVVWACNSNTRSTTEADTTKIRELPADDDEVTVDELTKEDFYVWKVDIDNKTVHKNPKLKTETLGIDTLITGLNEMYPRVKLEKLKQGHDTLYTQIREADVLTEQMGSAGSEAYIAQAVLNLTSAKGIRYLRIDFEMGSHASPDVWSKEDFKDYKPVQ
jgi:hypothetical protein